MTRKAIWSVYGGTWLGISFLTFVTESVNLCSVYSIVFIINFITEEDEAVIQQQGKYIGLIYALTFGVCFSTASLLRNLYVFLGCKLAVNIRKTLVTAMYDKVGKLSMKSLTETNSGKLITLVSSDIYTVEYPFSMTPSSISGLFSNLVAYTIIGVTEGWIYSLIIFSMSVLLLCLQALLGKK